MHRNSRANNIGASSTAAFQRVRATKNWQELPDILIFRFYQRRVEARRSLVCLFVFEIIVVDNDFAENNV